MNPRSRKARLLGWLLPKHWLMTQVSGTRETIYLTFDDGPNPACTPALLDLLRAHDAKATFFLVGALAESAPQLVQRIVDEGHRIGNHSWHHKRFHLCPLQEQLDEIARTDRLLQQHDGHPRHDFRPPQGVLTWRMLAALVSTRTRIAYWSYDSMDYRDGGAAEIIKAFEQNPFANGDIVLMHDDDEKTLSALEVMLPRWCASGWRFDALPVAGDSPR
jgi:peptidoglycan/xylan/chitin deacetylase (PgdA/CDA1 family)